MANGIFNVAKGQIAYYASLPLTNDALVVVLLQSTGLVSDATMRDYQTLAAVLAGNTEAAFTNYARKTLVSVAATVDYTNDWVDITAANFTYTAAGGATNNTIGKLIIGYDNDTTAGTDTNIIPVSFHDCSFTTDGTDQTITIPSPGFARAA